MDVDAFDFALPETQIAQAPLGERDASRLMYLPRALNNAGVIEHRSVRELPSLLRAGDLMIVNDARVVPARLRGKKKESGGRIELLLVEPAGAPGEWLALGQSSKPMREGQLLQIFRGGRGAGEEIAHEVLIVEVRGGGELRVRLPDALASDEAVFKFLDEAGALPLPPYIERAPSEDDRERYQTLFARVPGAIAAPTAGLHFTPALLEALRERGVQRASVTLHVGPGTFLPVRASRTEEHKMHRERYEVPPETARLFAETRARGGRIVAVGTTALRTLEAAFDDATGSLREGPGSTELFCTPGYRFRAVDILFTNFHLPKSTLLMLVCAFAGMERALAAYRVAVAEGYRFFSYGDAMLIEGR